MDVFKQSQKKYRKSVKDMQKSMKKFDKGAWGSVKKTPIFKKK